MIVTAVRRIASPMMTRMRPIQNNKVKSFDEGEIQDSIKYSMIDAVSATL